MATLDINDVLPQVDYTAIAAQTAFTVPFEFFADADLVVLVDGEVQALNTDYTVTGAEVEGGGAVTFTSGLAGGEAVRIFTDIAIARDVKYTQSGSLSHLVLERDMAKQIRIAQQLERDIGRCIRLMQSDPTVSMELPAAADRANKYLAFGASGELEVAEEVTGITLSQSVIGGYLYPRTAAEIAAGVTPAYYNHVPGAVERYAFNTVPGTTPMAVALTAAAAQGNETGGAMVTGDGNYSLESTVNLRNATVDMPNSTLTIAHAGIGIICGGNSSSSNSPPQRFGTIERTVGTASTTVPDVRIMGAKSQNLSIERGGWVQLYADTDSSATDSGSSAYCLPDFKYIDTLEFNTNATTDGSLTQWLNENRIKLGRCREFIMAGTYGHSNNIIEGGTFEDDTKSITITSGYSNQMNNLRLESGANINFGEKAFRNRLIQSWTSSDSDALNESLHTSVVTDDGLDNVAVKQISLDRKTNIIAHASVDDVALNNQSQYADRTPSLAVVRSSGSAKKLISTRKFRVYKNDIVGFYTETMSAVACKYRMIARFYDSTGVEVLPVLATSNTFPIDGNYYSSRVTTVNGVSPYNISSSAGHDDQLIQIRDSEIAWCQVDVISSSSQLEYQTAREIVVYVRRLSGNPTTARRNAFPDVGIYNAGNHAVTAAPTQGYAPLGYTVFKSDGTGVFVCTRSVDTTLASSASGGATSIVLTDATGITSGDIIGIQNDDLTVTDWRTVNSAAGSPTITISGGGLTGACAAGNRVVFLRWSAVTY